MAAIIGKAIPEQRKRVIDAMHLREPDRVLSMIDQTG